MRHVQSLLFITACAGPAEDSAVLIDTSERITDPCVTATDLAHWPSAVVSVDGTALFDFRSGVNAVLDVSFEGNLVERDSACCPGGFAIEQTSGAVAAFDLCVDSGPALPPLPADGRSVTAHLIVPKGNRGEYQLVVSDDLGLLWAQHTAGLDDTVLDGLSVTQATDQLVCLDGEAFQSLLFTYDGVSVEVDSGAELLLQGTDMDFEARNFMTIRGPNTRHLSKWSGSLFSFRRTP